MTTKKKNLLKALAYTMLAVMFIAMESCNSNQTNSTENEADSLVSEKSVEAPALDIFAASFMGDVAAIEQHILAGSDLNMKDQYGSSPLIIAATFGKTEVAKSLIKGGVDLNLPNDIGSSPLHIAAFFCRVEIVEALLAEGADNTLKNDSGQTALESVSGPFIDVKEVYDFFSKELGPLGFKLDYEHIENTRPVIAEMLK